MHRCRHTCKSICDKTKYWNSKSHRNHHEVAPTLHSQCSPDCVQYLLNIPPRGVFANEPESISTESMPIQTLQIARVHPRHPDAVRGKAFKILCVVDPRFRAARASVSKHTCVDWVIVNIPRVIASPMLSHPAIAGLIYPATPLITPRVDEIAVNIQEWVFASALGLGHAANLDVEFMKWEDFRYNLLSDFKNIKEFIAGHEIDAFIGGAELQLDISESVYGLGDQAQEYVQRMEDLSRILLIWPPIEEMKACGYKFDTVQNLDAIARNRKRARPLSRIIRPMDQITTGYLAKREMSDTGRHVIFSDHVPGFSQKISNRVPPCVSRMNVKVRWFEQQRMPLLLQWGEWRAFVVGERMITTVLTRSVEEDHWEWSVKHESYTLAEMSNMLREDPGTSSMQVSQRLLGTLQQNEDAKLEFNDFVTTTLSDLIDKEEAKLETRSSLRVFCRVDVGVIQLQDGSLDYFVNEVERGPATGLWTRDDPWIGGVLGPEIGIALYNYLSAENEE